jgi:uncharacterized membrane protein YdjX (TVP38/TMEM64 family)
MSRSQNDGPPAGGDDRGRPHHDSRSLFIFLAVVVAVALIPQLHEQFVRLTETLHGLMRENPRLAAGAFVAVSAMSAMLAFLSSLPFIPAAVETWGHAWTVVLLWIGWIAGGLVAYSIGRTLGRPAIARLIGRERLERYEGEAAAILGFGWLVVFQLAVPSEIPGYLLGMLRFRLRIWFVAMALTELPYAVGAVFAGESVLDRDLTTLLTLLLAGLAVSLLAARLLARRRKHASVTAGTR